VILSLSEVERGTSEAVVCQFHRTVKRFLPCTTVLGFPLLPRLVLVTTPNLLFAPPKRYKQNLTSTEKPTFLQSWSLTDVDLSTFRAIFGSTPFSSAGGWNDTNSRVVIESGRYDALLYGRYFITRPDLMERLKVGRGLTACDRSRFYAPFEDNGTEGTDYLSTERIKGCTV
jgi:hypothetical protein